MVARQPGLTVSRPACARDATHDSSTQCEPGLTHRSNHDTVECHSIQRSSHHNDPTCKTTQRPLFLPVANFAQWGYSRPKIKAEAKTPIVPPKTLFNGEVQKSAEVHTRVYVLGCEEVKIFNNNGNFSNRSFSRRSSHFNAMRMQNDLINPQSHS